MAMLTVIGLMSGTSMDGVDLALLTTDGEVIAAFGATSFRRYTDAETDVLKAALAEARTLPDRAARPGMLSEAERIVTDVHCATVQAFLRANPSLKPDLIGFHGQTVLHAPERRMTVQVGDGTALAARLGVPVVHDFRAADVAAGGEGAPLVPVYHRALAARTGLTGDIVIVNIGGVANITRIGADEALLAGDTGPGNALIDDLVRARTGAPLDRDGVLAERGTVDDAALSALMADPWFDGPLPKSIDRNAFSPAPVDRLSTEDAVATLAAFTAKSIAAAITAAGGADTVVVVGGGGHNPAIVRMLGEALGRPPLRAADLGWNGDFIEAQAFAYLAARSLAGLPFSYPETTGISRPMTGGVLVRP